MLISLSHFCKETEILHEQKFKYFQQKMNIFYAFHIITKLYKISQYNCGKKFFVVENRIKNCGKPSFFYKNITKKDKNFK